MAGQRAAPPFFLPSFTAVWPPGWQAAPCRPEAGSHVVRVEGGVVLRFGGSDRREPFRETRSLDIAWVPGGESNPAQ